MIIRDLRPDDIPVLVEWLKGFSASFDYPGKGPISDEAVTAFVSQFIGSSFQFALIAEHKNKPVAVIGFSVLPHPWTGQKVLYKAFWYSERAGAGLLLLRYVRDLAKAWGCTKLVIGSMLPDTDALLASQGFKPSETSYVLEL